MKRPNHPGNWDSRRPAGKIARFSTESSTSTTVMRNLIIFMLCIFAAASAKADTAQDAAPAATAWALAAAPIRLRVSVNSRRHPQLFVPVPSALPPELRFVSAFMDDGTELPASPVISGDRLAGVALYCRGSNRQAVPAEDTPSPNVSIYLLDQARADAMPFFGDNARPVALERSIRPLTTRAFTAKEMLRLFNQPTKRRQYFVTAVPALGAIPDRDAWQQPPEQQRLANAMLRWEARIVIDQDRAIAFGADQSHTAWVVLVNGQPVADWTSDTKRPTGGAFGAPVTLKAGLHTLLLFAVQRQGETIPRCLMRDADDDKGPGAPPAPLIPAAQPDYWGIEFAADPARNAHAVLAPSELCHFLQTDQRIAQYQLEPPAKDQAFQLQWLAEDGSEIIPAAHRLSCRADFVPGLRIISKDQALTLPGYHHWQPGMLLDGRLAFAELPPVIAQHAALPIAANLSWPEDFPEELRAQARILCEQLSAHGTVLRQDALPFAGGTSVQASIALQADCHSLQLRCTLAQADIFPAQPLRIIRPRDAVLPLQAEGQALYTHQGTRAVLVCDALPPPGSGTLPQRQWPAQPLRLALFDDLIASTSSFGADELPEQHLGALLKGPGPLSVSRVNVATITGAAPELAALSALPQLIATRPDFALLAVGATPLSKGQAPAAWCQSLLFIAQACQATGIEPILVALPQRPGVTPATCRSAALLTKELGLSLGIAVTDLYSRQRLNNISTDNWYRHGELALPTPNDQARQWLSMTCAQALQRHFPAIFVYDHHAAQSILRGQP